MLALLCEGESTGKVDTAIARKRRVECQLETRVEKGGKLKGTDDICFSICSTSTY